METVEFTVCGEEQLKTTATATLMASTTYNAASVLGLVVISVPNDYDSNPYYECIKYGTFSQL